MANRMQLPALPRVSNPFERERLVRAGEGLRAWRPPRGDELRLLLYRAAWLPFWLSSDVPAPALPERDQPLPPGGPAGDHVAIVMRQLQRRLWLQRALSIFFRAAWLPILVGVIWLIVDLRGGPALRFDALIWVGVALLPPAVLFAYLARPSRRQIARMLDRSFGLQDRLQTALENVGRSVPADGERAPVTYLQMADAANVMTDLRAHPAFKVRPPVREVVLAIACALLLGALFFVRGIGGGLPPAAENVVPAFVPAADRLAMEPEPEAETSSATVDAPTREEVQARAERSNQAQQDLKKLGDALADQAVTRSVSEAIARGDYDAAADQLREIAENADQWSPAAREALANELDQAADEMSSGDGQLAEAARDAADGLRQGGEAAQEGVSNLGEAVDQTASEIVSQRELADQMRQASDAEAQRGESGEGSQSGDPGSGAQDEAGNPSGGDSEESEAGSEAGSSGAGADAQPGQGSDGEQSGQSGDPGAAEGGEAGSAPQSAAEADAQVNDPSQGAGQPGQPGQASQAGDGQQPGAPSEGQGESGNQEGSSGEGGDQGGGAGSGESSGAEGGSEGQPGAENEPGAGVASDPNVSEADGGEGDPSGPGDDPRSAITLSRSPDAGGVQTSGNGGSSSVGSGSGATVAGGDSVQGEVGATGPDSNRVPPAYRGIVEDYFSEPDGP